MPSSVERFLLDHPPWKHILVSFVLDDTSPATPVWEFLRGLHPFSVTVEPEPNATGSLQLLVSNQPFFVTNLPGSAFATLGDPLTGPSSFMYDAPFQSIGVYPLVPLTGIWRVHIFASPYSRNIQP